MASEGPKWNADSLNGDIVSETNRLYALLSAVLEVPPPASPSRRSKSSSIGQVSFSPSPAALLTLLDTHLPRSREQVDKVLELHHRPSALTRLWFPLLFLPPAAFYLTSTVVRNKEWMKEQVRNAKETVRGFFISWVWEPIEDIGKTLRGGGEGLGVAPTTVKSDQEVRRSPLIAHKALTGQSLERMVMDLGRDYYHMSPSELNALGDKIKAGDMEDVLRVYEKELQASHPCGLGDTADHVEPGEKRSARELDQNSVDPGPKDKGERFVRHRCDGLNGRPTSHCHCSRLTTSCGLSSSPLRLSEWHRPF